MELHVKNVSLAVRGRTVLHHETVCALPGRTLALVGPSGCGKTTLLGILGLLHKPDTGTVLADGTDTSRWKDDLRRRFWQRHAAFVFQDYGLIDDESVAYNVALSRLSLFGSPRKHMATVEKALARVALGGRALERCSRLSGGERQRVGLARAIFRRADVILADEPTASLDLGNRELVAGFLQAEAARGATVVVATHDEDLITLCDEVHHVGATRPDLGATRPDLGATRPDLGATRPDLGTGKLA
jgi:putative ABC transport system ATP-binding protein